jgi:hypothetical protein
MPRETWQCSCGKRNRTMQSACQLCKLPRCKEDFDHLVGFLRLHGYDVTPEDEPARVNYHFASFVGQGIRGGFATYGIGYPYLDGRVAADNRRCFDKWSKCPLVVRIPDDDEGRSELLEYFRFLASKEGYKWSNTFEYLDNHRLPYDVT